MIDFNIVMTRSWATRPAYEGSDVWRIYAQREPGEPGEPILVTGVQGEAAARHIVTGHNEWIDRMIGDMIAKASEAVADSKCKCGCGETTEGKAFLPGHDLRAALRIIKEHYGTIENFIDATQALIEEGR